MGLLKLYFAEGRPFFLNSAIRPQSCKDLEFGYPSGHTAATSATYLTLYFCLIRKMELTCTRTSRQTNRLIKVIGLLVVFLGLVIIGFSRLYVGAHSFDQLLTGWVLGLVTSVTISMSIDSEIR